MGDHRHVVESLLSKCNTRSCLLCSSFVTVSMIIRKGVCVCVSNKMQKRIKYLNVMKNKHEGHD